MDIGWSPREAIGRQLPGKGIIIGVVENFLNYGLDTDGLPGMIEMYPSPDPYPFEVTENSNTTINYMVAPEAVARIGNLEREIMTSDPDAVIFRNTTIGNLLRSSVQGRTFATFSVTLFALCAIGIVVVNIVNTVVFIISRRKRDIAIYIALGVPSHNVCWLVMRDMVQAGIGGIIVGGMASWWIGKAVAHFIYNGDKYQNPFGLALTAAVMLAIIGVAAWIPATRALKIDPNTALHSE